MRRSDLIRICQRVLNEEQIAVVLKQSFIALEYLRKEEDARSCQRTLETRSLEPWTAARAESVRMTLISSFLIASFCQIKAGNVLINRNGDCKLGLLSARMMSLSSDVSRSSES